jgi:predicted phage replisome organizer
MIETLPECDTIIVIWFKLLCLAGKQNNSGVFQMGHMPYTDEMFSTIFRRPLNTVRLALKTFEQFGMIEIIHDTVTIPNWGKHQSIDQIESRNAYMKNYMREYREKQKQISSGKSNRKTNSKVNVSEADKIREEEIREDETRGDKKKETTHDLLQRLLPDYVIPMVLQVKMKEWITYKTERKESYKEQGMKSLLSKIEDHCVLYGDQAVCDLIDDSMANGWKGIIFDRLKQNAKRQAPSVHGSSNPFLDMLEDGSYE